jgi:fructose 1,6-bisphosphate aldolase/phosphatase
MGEKITLSIIKADVGGWVGHSAIHPEMHDLAEKHAAKAKKDGIIIDYFVGHCGDDHAFILTHRGGIQSAPIHKMCWDAFLDMTELAKKLGLYGAGQDILSDAFSGNLRGMGPGYAEMEFEERTSEPIICFLADKTEPGAWNMPLYKMFCDPFNTAGLVIDQSMFKGFDIEVDDLVNAKKVVFDTPLETYPMLSFIGAPGRFVIKNVYTKSGEIVATTSTQRLSFIAGKYVGKDDPVMAVRCQSGMPAVGEVLNPFAFPHIVAGWMRGSHHGPLMPVSMKQDHPTRFDGPPRVVALGFQLKDGKLNGPRDMFEDISFDRARTIANEMADYLKAHGPFEPHRLPLEDMEYTNMPYIMETLKDRWVDDGENKAKGSGKHI